MARIIWTEESLCWLRQIRDYIARDNPRAAQKTIQGIYDKVQLLERNPLLGQIYRTTARGDIRVTLYGHYRITYLVRSNDAIEILGVFHAALDIDRYLP